MSAPEAAESDPKDPRRVLLFIDVNIAGQFIGQVKVRRDACVVVLRSASSYALIALFTLFCCLRSTSSYALIALFTLFCCSTGPAP